MRLRGIWPSAPFVGGRRKSARRGPPKAWEPGVAAGRPLHLPQPRCAVWNEQAGGGSWKDGGWESDYVEAGKRKTFV